MSKKKRIPRKTKKRIINKAVKSIMKCADKWLKYGRDQLNKEPKLFKLSLRIHVKHMYNVFLDKHAYKYYRQNKYIDLI